MQPEDYALAITLGAIENLKSGNTSVCEIFFSSRYEDGADVLAARALADTGIRSLFVRCSNDEELAPGFVESTVNIANRSRALIDAWAGHERLAVGVGPLAPWSATEEYWADTLAFAHNHDTEIHLHTAESADYNVLMQERTGRRNVEYLADKGVLGDHITLSHCVHINNDEIALIAESGSRVIHNPTSNMILADGVAPVPDMRKAGILVGLACDGPACNNTQDMFEVMKIASLLHKVTTGDAEVLTAGDVFAMATRVGAQACGLGDRIGSLTPGKLADIVIIDLHTSHLCPIHDPLATLVYSACAADVHTVIVGGRIVVRAGDILTVDETAIIHRAQERAEALRSAANV
jgi:5-methylthioadenosine/S-adenosylhomocysteine deaminase